MCFYYTLIQNLRNRKNITHPHNMKPIFLYTTCAPMYNEAGDGMYRISFDSPMPLQMAGRFSETKGWNHNGRTLDRSFLCVLTEGSCTFVVDGNRIELNPGDGVIVPENAFYAPCTQEGCRYQYFHFRAKIQRTDEPAPLSPSYRYSAEIEHSTAVFYLPEHFAVDSSIRYSLDAVLNEMPRVDPCSSIRMNLAFFDALTRIADRWAAQPERTLACEIENFILANLGRQPTLSMLSSHFGYTRQYIIRVFKQQFHQTPAVYINDAKLARAVRFLTEADLRIDEIARRCGFEDANYFSRQFKRKYGLTPSDYRRQSAGI